MCLAIALNGCFLGISMIQLMVNSLFYKSGFQKPIMPQNLLLNGLRTINAIKAFLGPTVRRGATVKMAACVTHSLGAGSVLDVAGVTCSIRAFPCAKVTPSASHTG